MLNKPLNTTLVNAALSIIIVILSFYTILWHNQNYLLYKKAQRVQKANQKITALHKQLLSEYSLQISGKSIKEKAIKTLQMKRTEKIRVLVL
jgi:cell division protein FtsL